jgi:hypothetical protein
MDNSAKPAASRGGAFRRFPLCQGVPATIESAWPTGAHKEVSYLPRVPANQRWIVGNREKWGPRSNELIKMFRETFLAR